MQTTSNMLLPNESRAHGRMRRSAFFLRTTRDSIAAIARKHLDLPVIVPLPPSEQTLARR